MFKTIGEIRRENARYLAGLAGSGGAFARKIDRAPTQVSRFIGVNFTSNIGDELARHIEEKFSMPSGWLDHEWSVDGGGGDGSSVLLSSQLRDLSKVYGVPLVDWADVGLDRVSNRRDVVCAVPHSPRTFATEYLNAAMHSCHGYSYPAGSMLFVDPDQASSVCHGDAVIAVLLDDGVPVFRVYRTDCDRPYLAPLNTHYPLILNRPFRILGKVIGAWLSMPCGEIG